MDRWSKLMKYWSISGAYIFGDVYYQYLQRFQSIPHLPGQYQAVLMVGVDEYHLQTCVCYVWKTLLQSQMLDDAGAMRLRIDAAVISNIWKCGDIIITAMRRPSMVVTTPDERRNISMIWSIARNLDWSDIDSAIITGVNLTQHVNWY